MGKRTMKKLTLSKERVRVLSSEALSQAAGGVVAQSIYKSICLVGDCAPTNDPMCSLQSCIDTFCQIHAL